MTRLFIPILSSILLLSCATKKATETSSNTRKDSKEQYPQAELAAFEKGSAPFTFNSVSVKGNFMEIEVTYGGGCQQHEFRLIGSPELEAGKPPVRNLQLFHKSNGDNCKVLITEKLKFSISNLAENTNSGNKVILKFAKYKETFEYSYE